MKTKILRTILVYLGIILLSCSIYLECGLSRALAFFWNIDYCFYSIFKDRIR